MTAEVLVSIYAAIVATGALFLEVRRWFESGPRIFVKASPNMMMFESVSTADAEHGLLLVTVYNRGEVPTTLTTLCLLEYPTWWARLRRSPARSFIVVNPQPAGAPPNLPKELHPGQQWMGIGRPRTELTGDLETGKYFAAIYTTHREQPYIARIRKRRAEPAGDTQVTSSP